MRARHVPAGPSGDPGPLGGVPASAGFAIPQAVRELQQASGHAQRALAARMGLGPNDLNAIDLIVSAEEPLGPVELGDLLGMRSASATVLVDRLEQAGHLTRTPHASDRRRRVLQPTDHARTEVRTALTPLIEPLRELSETLTQEEAATVLDFLRRATEIFTDYVAEESSHPGS